MARRKSPDPAITWRWVGVLRPAAEELARLRTDVEQAEQVLGKAVRAAFAEGVLVGPMMQATGLSGSRLYQLKWALRDAGFKDEADAEAASERFREYRAELELPAVLTGPVVEVCQHPRTYGSGPRQGQCTVCHDQVELTDDDCAELAADYVANPPAAEEVVEPGLRLHYRPNRCPQIGHRERRAGKRATSRETECVACGSPFTYEMRRGRPPLTCSAECRRQRIEQARGGQTRRHRRSGAKPRTKKRPPRDVRREPHTVAEWKAWQRRQSS
jgi:hypothetical protein